jgi:hypothetical protein
VSHSRVFRSSLDRVRRKEHLTLDRHGLPILVFAYDLRIRHQRLRNVADAARIVGENPVEQDVGSMFRGLVWCR